MNFLDSLNAKKRFSMNFMDTFGHHQRPPASSAASKNKKRFSMNFLDTLGPAKGKRFSMNFMDTFGASSAAANRRFFNKPLSSDFMREKAQAHRADALSNKRSDDRIAVANAEMIISNIDLMIDFLLERLGLEAVCGKEEWRDLLEVRDFLGLMMEINGQKFEAPKVTQKMCPLSGP